jgi:ferritin-like metal-binding protein YciE
MSKLSTLKELMVEEMRDTYSAETQIAQALVKMEAAATSPQLKAAFAKHQAETQNQVRRLEQIFQGLGESPEGNTCEATEGLVKEADELVGEDADPQVLDAGLIASAQKIEHYEIASYGTLCTWAKQLGQHDILALLKESLNEEETTDKNLSMLAESGINQMAQ